MPEVRLDGLIILKQHERNISEKALYPLIRQTTILYDLLNQNSPLKYKLKSYMLRFILTILVLYKSEKD